MENKFLNGLAYNLAQSFFSTLNYYEKGYMEDWIVNSANERNISSIQIDVLKKQVMPQELSIKPILTTLETLQPIIQKTLESNNLPNDYIKEVVFKIEIYKNRLIKCNCYSLGKDNDQYCAKELLINSFENFTVF